MRRALIVALLAAGCGSSTPTAPQQPQGHAAADLKLNAQKAGTFDCAGGLFFTTRVDNQTTAPVAVSALALNFTRVAGQGCSDHPAPIDSAMAVSVPAGLSSELRRVDLAGDLCSPPSGAPGCQWLAKATISTSFGTLTDEIGFTTAGSANTQNPAASGCPAPSIDAPQMGEIVHGVVRVECNLPKKLPGGCDTPYMYFRWNGPTYLTGLMVGGPRYLYFVDTRLVKNANYGLWCEADYGIQLKGSGVAVVKVVN